MSLDAVLDKFFPVTQPTQAPTTGHNENKWQPKLSGSISREAIDAVLNAKIADVLGEGINGELTHDNGITKRRLLAARDDSFYDGDTSAADLAFASIMLQHGLTADQTELAMRAFRYREKFDQHRGKDTYLAMTINKARSSEQTSVSDRAVLSKKTRLPLFDGVIRFADSAPPARDYVALGMVMGKVYAAAGFGGSGKSQHAIQTAVDVATGGALSGEQVSAGSVLMIMGEDDRDEMARRFGATVIAFGLQPRRAEIAKRVKAFGMVGIDIRITAQHAGGLCETRFVTEIIDAAAAQAEESGIPVRFIILDHLGLFHGGDFNAREDAAMTMRIVNSIAQQTGAAVLLLAHSPKSSGASEESTSQDIAGSTAFVDQARGAFVLATMRKEEAKKYKINDDARKGFVSLTTVKNNYGPTGVVRWYQRRTVIEWGTSVLVPTTLTVPPPTSKSDNAIVSRVLGFVLQHRGEFSKTKIRNTYSGADGPLKASKNEAEIAIDQLISSGKLVNRVPTDAERKKYGLGAQVKEVLDAVTE